MSIRNARRDAIDGLKKAVKKGMPEDTEKDAENDAQKLHDKFMKKVEEVFIAKEKEIMTIWTTQIFLISKKMCRICLVSPTHLFIF